ncbi:hypothetical protein LWI29_032516 [Acer saccharum]|uniref:Branched-chain-amino-acid transaminase n=1 Tax=Acer saccharum TaxID=4024 RepID=A0AA39RPU4_ACESA|nr:hypothetical protein LWI29_032516 [Acer saccharum]KAK1555298.1 hypothetical protein Q3G72_024647 [Acer saccharum]
MVNSYGIFFSITANHLCSFTNTTTTTTTTTSTTSLLHHHSSSLKFHCKRSFGSSSSLLGPVTRNQAIQSDSYSQTSELAGRSWNNLGFDPISTDYMYTMKCSEEGGFSDGGLQPFQSIQLIPSACVLNYGQAIIEDLKAYKKQDDSILLFRPEEYGLCMRIGADRLCMPAPTIEQFVEAVKVTVLANRRWIPPPDKGFLHIRPLLMGSGAVLSVKSAPEFTFLIYVTPVGNYFVEGMKPINLVVENEFHRATRGGVGNVKAISNYASILKAQAAAKANGFSDVLYLDSVHSRYLEEVSTANIFIVKDKTISTPVLGGTIQPGITRKSVIDIARNQGFQIEERLVSIEELFDADEVFCAGDFVCLLPVGSITYLDKRVSYKERGTSAVWQQLYLSLKGIQMGLTEDKMGWTVVLQ